MFSFRITLLTMFIAILPSPPAGAEGLDWFQEILTGPFPICPTPDRAISNLINNFFSYYCCLNSGHPKNGKAALVMIDSKQKYAEETVNFLIEIGAQHLLCSKYEMVIPVEKSKRDFLRKLGNLNADNSVEKIDVFLFAHGVEYAISMDKQFLSTLEIEKLNESIPNFDKKLRMVYSTTCWGSTTDDAWLKAGAKTVVGAIGKHRKFFSYYKALKIWLNNGPSIKMALDSSFKDKETVGSPVIKGDADLVQ
ncbi:MAG: hypothetical protein WCG27_10660 [Pseudomonadota bacterium]